MANLTQLKMLEKLNAFLLVDKPAGIAFSSVVKAVKRKFNLVKVGHGGSLDACASGLMVLLINDANRFTQDIMGADRDYAGVMRLGFETNTCDIHGEAMVEEKGVEALPDIATKEEAFRAMRGDIFLSEPRFCAVRREGSAQYEIADTGEHPPMLVHVWKFTAEQDGSDRRRCRFAVSATKGLIVRAFAAEFGRELGCGGVLESCRRTRVGKFRVEDAVPFAKLLETDIKDFAQCTMSISEALR